MACISKLASAITYDCDTGATGLVSALIINKADIASFTVDGAGVLSALTLVAGAKAYKLDTVKRSVTLSSSLKVNDGAPNAFTHTATLTVFNQIGSGEAAGIAMAMTNGSFVILASHVPDNNSSRAAYGLYYGMSATAVDRHSHDNGGWVTITMSTPENVIGEDPIIVIPTLYASLLEAAV